MSFKRLLYLSLDFRELLLDLSFLSLRAILSHFYRLNTLIHSAGRILSFSIVDASFTSADLRSLYKP